MTTGGAPIPLQIALGASPRNDIVDPPCNLLLRTHIAYNQGKGVRQMKKRQEGPCRALAPAFSESLGINGPPGRCHTPRRDRNSLTVDAATCCRQPKNSRPHRPSCQRRARRMSRLSCSVCNIVYHRPTRVPISRANAGPCLSRHVCAAHHTYR